MKPILFIFSGLPCCGKSSIAKALSKRIKATYLRIDTIEQGIRDLLMINPQGEGYRLAYRICSDNLQLGNTVIADSCNPIELTRREWEQTAIINNANYVNIEIVCSNKQIHMERVNNRIPDIQNLVLPKWEEIQKREYHAWVTEHIIIDTSVISITDAIDEILDKAPKFLNK